MFSTGLTWTADGTSSYRIEINVPIVISGSGSGGRVECFLVDSTGAAIAGMFQVGDGTGTLSARAPANSVFRYTPTAGSTTVNFRAYYQNNGTSAQLYCSSGTGGNWAPIHASVYGPDLT